MSKKIIAVVGAGGKTTYIKNKAKEFLAQGKKVFVTTTTHMMKETDTCVSDDADNFQSFSLYYFLKEPRT